jgi:hypothetical protein
MPSFDVAHLREQGQDMIIAPLERSFGQKSNSDQNLFMRQLQARANAAGLRGTVALVWDGGFLAIPQWHPFFRTLSLSRVMRSINRSVSW